MTKGLWKGSLLVLIIPLYWKKDFQESTPKIQMLMLGLVKMSHFGLWDTSVDWDVKPQTKQAKIIYPLKLLPQLKIGRIVYMLDFDQTSMAVWFFRGFSQHFGNMTRPLELGIFASFYTKLGKNTPYNKNKNIKYLVYSTSYSSLNVAHFLGVFRWSPRVVPFMKILSDSWAKSSHILQQ